MADVLKSLCLGVLLQIFLLVGNAVGFALHFIVTAQSLIEGCVLGFLGFHWLPPFWKIYIGYRKSHMAGDFRLTV